MKLQACAAISTRFKLLLSILGLIGIGIILMATSHFGVGVSPDSVLYISVARNIAKGMNFVDFNGSPLVTQPPLYPAILALVGFISGIDPLSSTRILNALLFGASIYLSGLLFAKYLAPYPGYALLGTISVLVSIPLIPVFLMAWSEPLFIFFVLLFLIFFESYLKKKTLFSLVLLSLSVSFACLTRYIGIVLVITGVASISLLCKNNLKAKIWHLLLFIFLSTLPIGIWVIRNYLLSGTLFGPRSISTYTYSQNLVATFNNILYWYLPTRIANSRIYLMVLSTITGFIIGLKFKDVWREEKTNFLRFGLFGIFILIYTGFLVISSKTAFLQIIDNRYLSPIYVPTTILLLSLAKILFEPLSTRLPPRRVNIFLMVIVAVWLVYPLIKTISILENQSNQGVLYTSKSWRASKTIQYLLDHPTLESECTIYSNGQDVIYLLADLKVKSIPSESNGARIVANLSCKGPSYLVE